MKPKLRSFNIIVSSTGAAALSDHSATHKSVEAGIKASLRVRLGRVPSHIIAARVECKQHGTEASKHTDNAVRCVHGRCFVHAKCVVSLHKSMGAASCTKPHCLVMVRSGGRVVLMLHT